MCTFRIRKHGRFNTFPSTVQFYTMPGTARAGSDYVTKTVNVVFGITETVKTVTVTVVPSITVERAEVFTGKLRVISNARCYDCTAQAIITEAPVVTPPPPVEPPLPPPPPPPPTTKVCSDGSIIPIESDCPVPPPPPPPPPPTMQNCPDGSVILASLVCPPMLSISSVSADEGNFLNFVVTQIGASNNGNPTFSYVHRAVTATEGPGNDYDGDMGTKTITGGNGGTVIIPIRTYEDVIDEADKTMEMVITPTNGAGCADCVGLGTILDDDAAPPPPPPPPPPPGLTQNKITVEGDSISVPGSGQYPGIYGASHPGVTICNKAVSGSGIAEVAARISPAIACNSEVVTLFIGANDLASKSSSTAFLNEMFAYTDQLRALGMKVAVGTVLPLNNPAADALSPGYTARHNTRRNTEVNPSIRSAIGTHIDAVFDFAADNRIGDDADALNTSLYPDGLHPTGAYSIMAGIYGPVADALLAQSGLTPTPVGPPPTPTGWVPSPGLTGVASIPSNFNRALHIVNIPVANTSAPDPEGAFRFICMPGHILRDDPIVYPGQPGRSHLHQFYGNDTVNANSTYSSMRLAGNSTCVNPLNRSGYWQPAMLDGVGNVVRPDAVAIYYKQRPKSDPKCTRGNPQAMGDCINLPNGLRFIFGYDMITGKSPTGHLWFNCQGTGAVSGHYATIPIAMQYCPAGAQLGAIIEAPDCWDGANLDSPNHRDHVAHAGYGDWGYLKCPPTHPYVIPKFTLGAWYRVDANKATWHFSSDEMFPTLPYGTTFHADWFGAWDDPTKDQWFGPTGCIGGQKNCSDGDVGNGTRMKQVGTLSYTANPRLVPVSSIP
jgi:lysophospholipase L1-like esterase